MVQLTGGEKDTEAPKLLESLPNTGSVNFSSDQITLRFDEFIQLKDIANQVIVSPPLKTNPEFESRGKKINITLKKEELEKNTTYRIYFGNSVCDMHESNPLKQFEYIFSTGPVIDTFKTSGKIEMEFDKSEPGECVVALYNTAKIDNDSFAFQSKADYLVKSNKNGEFNFKYLPEGDFRAIAFLDKNKNYQYDGVSEKIAFAEKTVNPIKDTASIQLRMFEEITSKLYLKKTLSPYYGKIQLIYSKACIPEIKSLNDSDRTKIYMHHPRESNDTISLFYRNIEDTLKLLVTNPGIPKTDTLILTLPKLRKVAIKKIPYTSNFMQGVLEKHDRPTLTFYSMIDTLLAKKSKFLFKMKKDSAYETERVAIKIIDPLTIELDKDLAEGIDYQFACDTAIFKDHTGKYNDSIKGTIAKRKSNELGNLKLNLLLDKKQHYLVQLVTANQTVVMERSLSLSLSSSNQVEVIMNDVFPGTYKLKVIYDDNANNRWDTGNILEKRQPEKVSIPEKQIKIMADWDVEEEIRIQ